MSTPKSKPRVFATDDPNLVIEKTPPEPPPALRQSGAPPPAIVTGDRRAARGVRWGAIFLSAVGGLVTLAASAWLYDLVLGLLARGGVLGWLGTGLMALAALAGAVIIAREAVALMRLARLGALAREARKAIDQGDKAMARDVVTGLDRLYADRKDMAWARARFAEHQGDIMDARELLTLAERELVAPLDAQARDAVAAAAKRVSVLTAISPAAIVDMLLVAAANMRMLGRVATIYGARPAALGLLKLARMVVSHIVVTGGIAIGDDMLQQLLGQKLTAKISARLGEGVFNGALTARIGIAALSVCRPLPHVATKAPRFRDLASQAVGFGGSGEKS